MRAEPRLSPATVAPVPGAEVAKLLQRFHQLTPANQSRLLDDALGMMRRQELDLLPPREREIRQLVDRVERILELIETEGADCQIKTAMWRMGVNMDKARLIELGVDYYGPADVASGTA